MTDLIVRSSHSTEGRLTRVKGERPVKEIRLRDKPEPRAFVGDSRLSAFVGKSQSSSTPPNPADLIGR